MGERKRQWRVWVWDSISSSLREDRASVVRTVRPTVTNPAGGVMRDPRMVRATLTLDAPPHRPSKIGKVKKRASKERRK